MKKYYGWMYCEEGEIIVKWSQGKHTVSECFPDSNRGASRAAETISERIGNNWKLEPFTPLGYRIVSEE